MQPQSSLGLFLAAHECGAFGSSFGPEPARRKKKRRQQCWVRTSLAAWAACKDSPRALPASVLCAHPPKTTKNLRWQNRVAWRCCGGACGAASCGSSGAGRARDAHGAEFGGRHGDARPRGSRRLRPDVYVHLNRGGRGTRGTLSCSSLGSTVQSRSVAPQTQCGVAACGTRLGARAG